MKKEYLLATVIGMFLLAYLLDAVVDPLQINLATPYQYFTDYLSKYPFTSASVIIRGLAIFLTPLLFLSFITGAYTGKAITLLILSVLMQLYATQDIATDAHVVPIEWALALTLGGVLLALPTILFFIKGSLKTVHHKLKSAAASESLGGAPDWTNPDQ